MFRLYYVALMIVVALVMLAQSAWVATVAAQPSTPESESAFSASGDAAVSIPLQGAAPAVEAPSDPGSWPIVLLLIYCVLVIVASLLGGWLPSWIRLTHTRMQAIISFVGGLMLGIGVFHMIPHATHQLGNATTMAHWMMVGIVVMFALIRLFHFHNHEPVHLAKSAASASSTCDHDHDHDHDDGHTAAPISLKQQAQSGKGHSAAECHAQGHAHGMSWMGIALGLSLHTLVDGIALAVSVHADSQRVAPQLLLGLGTFLAVLLHKPLDAVSITALMVNDGWKQRTINQVNVGFALMCPLGAVLFYLGVTQFSGIQREFVGTALAFSAGVFICIALSDLLPEMEFHAHNKVELTIALALGIGLSWALTLLEAGHLH